MCAASTTACNALAVLQVTREHVGGGAEQRAAIADLWMSTGSTHDCPAVQGHDGLATAVSPGHSPGYSLYR